VSAYYLYHTPSLPIHLDNIAYYECDVSKWEDVEAVSKKIIEEVRIL